MRPIQLGCSNHQTFVRALQLHKAVNILVHWLSVVQVQDLAEQTELPGSTGVFVGTSPPPPAPSLDLYPHACVSGPHWIGRSSCLMVVVGRERQHRRIPVF